MSDNGKTDRALDLLVYAPVGVALYLRDTVPTFVNLFVSRGKAELGQRRQQAQDQVAQARAMGEFAVNFGGPKVREHVEKGIALGKGAVAVRIRNLFNDRYFVTFANAQGDHVARPRSIELNYRLER